jgi:RNA recognition motif-containing protein
MLQGENFGSKFEPEKTLIIGNLSDKIFEGDLFNHFKAAGFQVANVKIPVDLKTKKSKTHGYLNFRTAEEAARCLKE